MTTTFIDTIQERHWTALARHGIGLLFATLVTAGLFWLMQYLIETADRVLADEPARVTLEFVRLQRDESVRKKTRDLPQPPRIVPPPEMPRPGDLSDARPTITVGEFGTPEIPTRTRFGPGDFGGFGEGDYLPIVKVEPIYPRRALSRGIEGYCVIQYTVTRNGSVRDPFVVENQCTHSAFQRVSLEAVLKFRYKPRVIDGVAMEVPGVQNRFTFRITD